MATKKLQLIDGLGEFIKYTSQELTDNQKAQARDNIGAVNSLSDFGVTATATELNYLTGALSNALAYRGILTSSDDMNDVKNDGVYVYATSSVPTNAPYSNAAVVLVFGSESTSSRKVQIGIRYGDSGKMSFRALYNSSWQEWTEVITNTNSLVSAPKYEIAYDHRDQFFPYGAYGINLRNSDIYQANGIYFSRANDEDISDQFYEGLNFPRNDGKWDSIRVQEGSIKFVVGSTNDFGENNATKGTEYTVDYPVASGTSGVWTYRKWSSGIAECWGKVTTIGTSGTSSLGTATTMPYQMYTATFPFTFASAPVVTVGGVDGGTGLATASVSGEATKTSATLELVGSTSAIASGCYVYVIGKWK
jgi:hypothetical protein